MSVQFELRSLSFIYKKTTYSPAAQRNTTQWRNGEMANFKEKPKKQRIEIRVSHDELTRIEDSAKQAALGVSSYLRTLGLEYQVKGKIDQQAILQLLSVASDLGRLGGLLKLWLSQRETHLPVNDLGLEDVNALYQGMKELQSKIYDKVEQL